MKFNHRKLKGRIVEMYGTQGAFAKAFGVSENTFSKKMKNKVQFSQEDIVKISNMLDIPAEEIGTYFFTVRV